MKGERRKNLFLMGALLFCALLLVGCNGKSKTPQEPADTKASQAQQSKEKKEYYFKTEDSYFVVYNGKSYEKTYLNGVNLGSGKPGCFPGELGITKEEYLRWFQEISQMNCNTIRVYTVMMPCFYEALYEYNETAENKLYLFQGVWYDEDQIVKTEDAYDIYDEALSDAYDLVDIIHGDADLKQKAGKAYGKYQYDVSEYVSGWILGIESDAEFVGGTNENHAAECSYQGVYLGTTEEANPFETFMCKLGDQTLSYEMKKYQMQRPISWSNWPTADMLSHPNEPGADHEDAVTINVEHIKATDAFEAGVFASYHVYPYYPEFIMYDTKYASYQKEDGAPDNYKAYLEDLIAQHTVPVLVAEYGVPSSRGCTHENPLTGFNQGNLSEKQQGEMLASMATDIYDSGCCGGIAFTWQDEWFKRTWNTMDYSDPERRAYWSDVQTSEQNFGLLAFDPGKEETVANVDGDLSEWEESDVVAGDDYLAISLKQDARYLYMLVQGKDLNPENQRILIPLDITPQSGSTKYDTFAFSRAVDFVIDLNGKEDSSVKVQHYYDRYTFSYQQLDESLDLTGYEDKQADSFVPVYLCLNKELVFPETKQVLEFSKYDTGKLQYGNGNPDAADYDSLSDFCYGDHAVELRIPWSMLNFRDPSTKEIEADFHGTGELSGYQIDEIYAGVCTENQSVEMQSHTWDNWDQVIYHERLKQSYDILKDCYANLKVH